MNMKNVINVGLFTVIFFGVCKLGAMEACLIYDASTDSSQAETLKTLLEKKEFASVIDKQDARGFTPLHYSAISGRLMCMDVLIRAGANPNIKDFAGNTALHHAVIHARPECVEILLRESKIDVKSEDLGRNTALDLAYYFERQSKRKDDSSLKIRSRIVKILEEFYTKNGLKLTPQYVIEGL